MGSEEKPPEATSKDAERVRCEAWLDALSVKWVNIIKNEPIAYAALHITRRNGLGEKEFYELVASTALMELGELRRKWEENLIFSVR